MKNILSRRPRSILRLHVWRKGYITYFQDQNTATGKRRTYYQITGKGRAYYQEKCEEWLLTQEVVEQFIRKGETENGSY